LLEKPNFSPFVKHQIHDKSATKDQSGMICSGQQTVAFFDLDSDFLTAIEMILADPETKVTIPI
jgi:xanthine dehydrogenase accessory factor